MIPQTKTLPTSEAENQFSELITKLQKGTLQEVIIASRGKPIVAMIPIKDISESKKQQQKALSLLRNARVEVQARIKGELTDNQADKLSDRFRQDFVDDLEKEGKITFEKNSS